MKWRHFVNLFMERLSHISQCLLWNEKDNNVGPMPIYMYCAAVHLAKMVLYCTVSYAKSNIIQYFVPSSGVFRIWQRGAWWARRARAYNGGLGAEAPAGSRGRVPLKPPEAETLFAFERSMEAANSPIFSEIRKRGKSQRHIRCNLTWRV